MAEEKRVKFKDIRASRRDVFQVDWPGTKRKVGILLLRCSEIQAAHFAAIEHFQKQVQPTEGMSMAEFVREKELQEAFLMLLQPGSQLPGDRLFGKADEARHELSLDEVAWIHQQHETHLDQVLRDRGMLPALPEGADESESEE
jgi:AraC-like DNA-binding protein